MSVVQFQDATFLDYKGNWFIWEPSWEQFRPIQAVQWDGTSFRIRDEMFCTDPSDSLYGYGTEKMKQVCEALQPYYKPNAPIVPTLVVGTPEWFRDRMVSLSPCAPRDKDSWKRMCRGRLRTCRHPPRVQKLTRRSIK
jgi:hypothetical protein